MKLSEAITEWARRLGILLLLPRPKTPPGCDFCAALPAQEIRRGGYISMRVCTTHAPQVCPRCCLPRLYVRERAPGLVLCNNCWGSIHNRTGYALAEEGMPAEALPPAFAIRPGERKLCPACRTLQGVISKATIERDKMLGVYRGGRPKGSKTKKPQQVKPAIMGEI